MIIELLKKDEILQHISESRIELENYQFYFSSINIENLNIPEYIKFDDSDGTYILCYDDKESILYENKYSLNESIFPIILQDVFNQNTIQYFNDNLRESDYCAADNHLYIYYSNSDTLILFMCMCNIKEIIYHNKIVFLIGEDKLSKYPIDFFKEYGIDYSNRKPSLLRPDECHRICYFYKGTFSGADFVTNVIAQSKDIILVRLWSLHKKTTILGETLEKSDSYKILLDDVDKIYKTNDVISFFRDNKEKICFSWSGDKEDTDRFRGADNFLEILEKVLTYKDEITVIDVFKAYFIVKDYLFKTENELNYRIVPCFMFEPHIGNPSIYIKIFESFRYKIQLSGFRDPLKRLATGIRRDDIPLYGLNAPVPCAISTNASYYSIRFEDLKLNPKQMCEIICQVLDIRFSKKMMEIDYYEKSTYGNIVRGYDLQPVVRPIDDVLCLFDQMRLRLFFREHMEYFGYPNFFGNDIPDNIIRNIFDLPFIISHNNAILTEKIKKILSKNYLKCTDEKRVRHLNIDRMPIIIDIKNYEFYKGSISINGISYMYSEETKSIFRMLDNFLIFFAKNNDLTRFCSYEDVMIINKNILLLVKLFNEQMKNLGENNVLLNMLFENVNMHIALDKLMKSMNQYGH